MRHRNYFAKTLLYVSSKGLMEEYLNPPTVFLTYYCNTAKEIITDNISQ